MNSAASAALNKRVPESALSYHFCEGKAHLSYFLDYNLPQILLLMIPHISLLMAQVSIQTSGSRSWNMATH